MRQTSRAEVGGWLHKGALVTASQSGAVVGGGGHLAVYIVGSSIAI